MPSYRDNMQDMLRDYRVMLYYVSWLGIWSPLGTNRKEMGIRTYAYNPRTWELEAGR